ncbi:signal recognition particle receptor subunit beta-like [Iris pallida]|uniref:Signal recognition particle receptor subunit beta n=1 Tax=Iris pallida TaxID=29817 RepID=A0AAX6FGP4_IRIPA|nr:signal recognition particle receptor subunit beta-like [Iris pallida]KAJ6815554.1 signal recognition particle receptor subunit beta-like [Iris pallida]
MTSKLKEMDQLMREAENWAKQAEQWVRQQPLENVYVAIAIVIFTSVFLILFRCFKHSKSNTIVLAGLSGSGKTTLFYQLRDGSSHLGTVTSMEPNIDTFLLNSEAQKKGKVKPVRVVDVPGHSRLRPKLDEFLPQAAGLVFVVDALDFLPNSRATAELSTMNCGRQKEFFLYLYDILIKASVVRKKIPIVIVCNKTDKVTAHSKEFIRKQLEKEIDKLRTSRTAISTADISDEYALGVPGEPFTFTQCHNKVTVAEASSLTGETSQIEQFIRENVKS